MNPTVYIVDDDESARESQRALILSLGLPAETFASAEEFLAVANPSLEGCLVTDLRMTGGLSGIELQERLATLGIGLPVIIVTAHAETPLTVHAVKRGAVTVLEKPCGDQELVHAVREAMALDARQRAQPREQLDFRERLESLTAQERVILGLIVEGAANKVIARRLNVSVRTVENRRQRIFEKTGTRSLAELVRLFVQSHGG